MASNRFAARALFFILLVMLPASRRLDLQASQIQVGQNNAVMDFPGLITFDLQVSANEPVQLVNLHYGVKGSTCEPGFSYRNLKFSPANSLTLSWSWHLRQEGFYLPPGTQVWWQWLIHTSDDQSLLTEIKTLTVQDPDHDWQSLEQDNIELEWYQGDASFGQMLLEIAIQSQARLASESGLYPPEQIHLLVYPDEDAIQSATLDLPEWTGGVAYPEFNTSLVAIDPMQISWARTVIPHEIAHLIIASRIFNCHDSSLPLWIVEGFSKFAEGSVQNEQQADLLKSLPTGELPKLEDLADQFPYEAGPASQAYLVSLAAVNYLLEIGGDQAFSRLLDQVQAGLDFDQALLATYGYRTDTLDQAWRAAQGYGEPPVRLPASNDPGEDMESRRSGRPEPEISLLPNLGWDISPAGLALGLVGLAAGLAVLWRLVRPLKK